MSRDHDRPAHLRYDGEYRDDTVACRFTEGGAAMWNDQLAGWRTHEGIIRIHARDLLCEGTIREGTVELTRRQYVGDEGVEHVLTHAPDPTPPVPLPRYRVVFATFGGDAPEPCTVQEFEAHCIWNGWPIPALREREDGTLECAEDLLDGRDEGIMSPGEPVLEPLDF